MRPNNRQRSRGGRSGGGGGGHQHHKQHHGGGHNPNRPPNRNQIFDSSGPDVRVRGNAHQVFDKYQALAREAAASGDRIMAEAYWQYADHYYRVIQTMGGFVHRNNQGWGDGEGAEGQPGQPQQQGQPNGQQAEFSNGGGNGYAQDEPQQQHRQSDEPQHRQGDDPQQHRQDRQDRQERQERQGGEPQQHRQGGERQQHRQGDERQQHRQGGGRDQRMRDQDQGDSEPGLGGVAFLQSGRSAPANPDPAADEQPDIPEFAPAGAGRRG